MHIQRSSLYFSQPLNHSQLTNLHLWIYLVQKAPRSERYAAGPLPHRNLGKYICRAMELEFEPYLSLSPVVMPSLLATTGAKADLSLYREFTPLLIPVFIYSQYSQCKSNRRRIYGTWRGARRIGGPSF